MDIAKNRISDIIGNKKLRNYEIKKFTNPKNPRILNCTIHSLPLNFKFLGLLIILVLAVTGPDLLFHLLMLELVGPFPRNLFLHPGDAGGGCIQALEGVAVLLLREEVVESLEFVDLDGFVAIALVALAALTRSTRILFRRRKSKLHPLLKRHRIPLLLAVARALILPLLSIYLLDRELPLVCELPVRRLNRI